MGLSSVLGRRRVKVEVSPVAALGSRGWIPDPVEFQRKNGIPDCCAVICNSFGFIVAVLF